MMKLAFVFALSVVGCISCASSVVASLSDTAEYRAVIHAPDRATARDEFQSTVLITLYCDGKVTAEASGVVVRGNHVLTAAHAVQCDKGALAVFVDPGDGAGRLATVDLIMPARDLARLSLGVDMSAWVTPTSMGPQPSIGQQVCWTAMSPMPSRRCGDVAPSPVGELWFNGVVLHGNSGGPVYDNQGRLIGITTATMNCEGAGYCLGVAAPILPGDSWLLE